MPNANSSNRAVKIPPQTPQRNLLSGDYLLQGKHFICFLTNWKKETTQCVPWEPEMNSAHQIHLNCIFNSIKGSRSFSPFTFSFWKERGYPILLPEDVPQNPLLIRKVQPCHSGCHGGTGTCSGPTEQPEHSKNCKKYKAQNVSSLLQTPVFSYRTEIFKIHIHLNVCSCIRLHILGMYFGKIPAT